MERLTAEWVRMEHGPVSDECMYVYVYMSPCASCEPLQTCCIASTAGWHMPYLHWCTAHLKSCRALNEHTNFERFWTAALTLFKVATNDNWTDIMTACMIQARG